MKKTRPSLQTPYDQKSGRASRPRGAAMISPQPRLAPSLALRSLFQGVHILAAARAAAPF